MKATPGTYEASLLDETLVVVFSEFSRNWPSKESSGSSDHWPFQSIVFAGGNVRPNQMIGGYDFGEGMRRRSPIGRSVPLVNEDGDANTGVPTSADAIATALYAMGIHDFFIPGGFHEITGVRRS